MTGRTKDRRQTMPIMQHELYANPNPRSRRAFPFVVVLQADLAEGDRRLVAPVAPYVAPFTSVQTRALPLIQYDAARYTVALPLISSLPRNVLRRAVGSLADYRDDITRALDWLFFGI
jgi:toxin CcdB